MSVETTGNQSASYFAAVVGIEAVLVPTFKLVLYPHFILLIANYSNRIYHTFSWFTPSYAYKSRLS